MPEMCSDHVRCLYGAEHLGMHLKDLIIDGYQFKFVLLIVRVHSKTVATGRHLETIIESDPFKKL